MPNVQYKTVVVAPLSNPRDEVTRVFKELTDLLSDGWLITNATSTAQAVIYILAKTYETDNDRV